MYMLKIHFNKESYVPLFQSCVLYWPDKQETKQGPFVLEAAGTGTEKDVKYRDIKVTLDKKVGNKHLSLTTMLNSILTSRIHVVESRPPDRYDISF